MSDNIDNKQPISKGRNRRKNQPSQTVTLNRIKPQFSRSIAASNPATHFRISLEDKNMNKLLSEIKKEKDTNNNNDNNDNKNNNSNNNKKKKENIINIPERVEASVAEPERSLLQNLQIFGEEGIDDIPLEKEWRIVKEHLLKEGRLERESALCLIDRAIEHLEEQPNMLELEAPLTICGDIHGQYFDLVRLLDAIGDPKDCKYLFLGDYVDRGEFSTEVCFLLLSIMLSYPSNFYMLRGNHESRLLTGNFNFKRECFIKYDEEVYDAFMDLFDFLPIAAKIKTLNGDYFACHGGLSPHLDNINEISQVNRFIEPPGEGILCDLLWSDPVPEDDTVGMTEEELQEWQEIDFRPNLTRGCSYEFGYLAAKEFVEKNNLKAIIRAHEVKRFGFEEHFFRDNNLEIPPVITVFSAPNYCDMYENRAAFIELGKSGKCNFQQITWTSHPYWLPNFDDAFTFSIPFIGECAASMYLNLLKYLGVDEDQVSELHDAYNTIKKQRKKIQNQITFTKIFGEPGDNTFVKALKLDQANERRPQKMQLQRAASSIW